MDGLFFLCITRDSVVKVDSSKIVYFESEGNYTTMITVNKYKTMVGMGLGNVLDELQRQLGTQARCFVRLGKRHIINYHYFQSMNVLKQQMVLSDSERFVLTLSVSREALKKFKSDFFDLEGRGFSI